MLSLSSLSFLNDNFDYDEYTIDLVLDHIVDNTLIVDLFQYKNPDKYTVAIYWRLNNITIMDTDVMTHDDLPERTAWYFNMIVPYHSLSWQFDDKNVFMQAFSFHPECKEYTGYTRSNKFMLKYRYFNNEPILLNNSSIDVVIQYLSNNKN